jgi:hypothetical protein
MIYLALVGLAVMIVLTLRIIFAGHERIGSVLAMLTGVLLAQAVRVLWD